MKGRGFDLETSKLRCLKKYKKLFAVVSMAYTLCWAIGIEESRKKPVKLKNHGYPQYSVFRRGLNSIRAFYKKQILQSMETVFYIANLRINGLEKTVG